MSVPIYSAGVEWNLPDGSKVHLTLAQVWNTPAEFREFSELFEAIDRAVSPGRSEPGDPGEPGRWEFLSDGKLPQPQTIVKPPGDPSTDGGAE